MKWRDRVQEYVRERGMVKGQDKREMVRGQSSMVKEKNEKGKPKVKEKWTRVLAVKLANLQTTQKLAE